MEIEGIFIKFLGKNEPAFNLQQMHLLSLEEMMENGKALNIHFRVRICDNIRHLSLYYRKDNKGKYGSTITNKNSRKDIIWKLRNFDYNKIQLKIIGATTFNPKNPFIVSLHKDIFKKSLMKRIPIGGNKM